MPSVVVLANEIEEVSNQWKEAAASYLDVDGNVTKDIPDDVSARLGELHQKVLGLKKEHSAEKAKAEAKDFANMRDFLTKPQRAPLHAINADDDGRKSLLQLDWEVRNGMIYAPTSMGNPMLRGEHKVAMYPEDVLFGEIPAQDPEAAQYFRAVRATHQPGYREAYTHWLRNATRAMSESMAYSMLPGREQAALSEGSDPAGGFLVPPDTQAEILVRKTQTAVIRRMVGRTYPTSRDRIRFPRVEPHATEGSIYSSGFVGSVVGETPAFSETDPVFGEFEVGIKKIRVATKLSNDFIADSASDILGFLAMDGGRALALVEDNEFITGDGSALHPLGILNGGATTIDVEGSTANTISNTTSSTGTVPKLLLLMYGVPSQYAENGQWLMRRAIEGDVHALVDANGRFMWPELSGSGFAPNPRTLLGYPINNSEFMPNDGTDANKVIVFGDFSAYIIAERTQITTVLLRERFADSDQTGIILMERVGGALWNPDSIRVGVV